MRPLDAVLRLRPTNAVNRLGSGSRVCLLSARPLQAALAPRPGALVCFSLPSGFIAPFALGVLRAARQLDAAVGVGAAAHGLGEGPRPWAVFQDVATAAAEVGLSQPLFLRGGPIALAEASPHEVAKARESVFQLVDAGFTEVALDATALDGEWAAAALGDVVATAQERELGVDLTAPSGGAEAVAAWLRAVLARGARPDVLSVGAGSANPEQLAALTQAAAPCSVELVDPRPEGARAPRVALARPFQALVERRRPASDLDWLEAHAYYEAKEALLAWGCAGSGAAAAQALAKRGEGG